MARLILFAVLLVGLALALIAAVAALRNLAGGADDGAPRGTLPGPVKAISYTFLMVLLLGVSTGWLGAN